MSEASQQSSDRHDEIAEAILAYRPDEPRDRDDYTAPDEADARGMAWKIVDALAPAPVADSGDGHPHTAEPWVCHSGSIYQARPVDADGWATNRIANMDRDNPETAPVERDSNAHRAVACVNALAGIDKPEQFVERAKRFGAMYDRQSPDTDHGPLPWALDVDDEVGLHITDGFGVVAKLAPLAPHTPEVTDDTRNRANANRIVACVNAVGEIDNPTTAIAALVDAARRCGEELRLIAERHGESLIDFSPVHAVDDALRGVRQAPTVTS